ncbi:MAG TPA: xanthine dehydrogenase family protein subunit M [Anaerovoracaceae bacterium]|nr:xanthine dehydrogenase family protein subunit M [Anaerovoracaceae bacterium]
MKNYDYNSPASFEELFAILAKNDSSKSEIKFLAGGTDLVPKISLEREQVPKAGEKGLNVVYLGKLGLDSVTENDKEVRIGALCTFTDIENNEIVKKSVPVLLEVIKEIAGITVRNSATLGGNIMNASPAADSVPVLIALDAKFVLKGPGGEKTVAAAEFFTGPGKTAADVSEVLAEIVIPKQPGTAVFRKIGRRKAETLSVVNAAAYVEADGNTVKTVRVAIGSVAPVVVRCKAVEQALAGKAPTADAVKAASEAVLGEISPIDDIRSTAWYRNKVAPVLVRRAIEAALGM